MDKSYPRIEMCDCGAPFAHAYFYASEDICSNRRIYSKEEAIEMIDYGQQNELLTPEGAKELILQLNTIPLPETKKDAWDALPEDIKNQERERSRKCSLETPDEN
ncbi:hypothetical protein ACFL29_01155 [Patescibacteria group bacterium]